VKGLDGWLEILPLDSPPTLTAWKSISPLSRKRSYPKSPVIAGTDTERLVKDAALRLLGQDARFRAAVRKHKVPPLRFAPVGMTELLLRSGRDDRVIASLRSG
jgi:hypothetical protein